MSDKVTLESLAAKVEALEKERTELGATIDSLQNERTALVADLQKATAAANALAEGSSITVGDTKPAVTPGELLVFNKNKYKWNYGTVIVDGQAYTAQDLQDESNEEVLKIVIAGGSMLTLVK